MQDKESNTTEETIDQLRFKRMQNIIGLWEYCISINVINGENLKISAPLCNEVVEHYLMDQTILKLRYNISNRIQPPKVAGLLTSLLLRYRPLVPISDKLSKDDIYANESFAILHGLSICGEFSSYEELVGLCREEWFVTWINNFIYLLHHRNHTPEALSFIYETLAMTKFKKALRQE